MRPGRQQHAAAHVELAGAEKHFALARQQRLSVEQDAHAGPVGDRHECGHRRLGVGHVEQAGDVAARPRCPSAVSQPRHPGRAPADRAGGAHAQESVAEREARFDGALGQHVVAFVAEDPARSLASVPAPHASGRSPCRARCATRRPPWRRRASRSRASWWPRRTMRNAGRPPASMRPRQAPPGCSMGERIARANARGGQSARPRGIMGMVRFVPQRLNQADAKMRIAAISQNSVALQGTQNRTPPTTPCEVLCRLLVSLISSCRSLCRAWLQTPDTSRG